jgi:PIN domain nuclease of toxin-antitoxin system
MILDASALLALLQNETGAETVSEVIGQAGISAVNWSEVIQKLSRHDPNAADIRLDLETLGLHIIPFTAEQAEAAAALWSLVRPYGLSLADRVCLQLGISLKQTVLTTDRVWGEIHHPELAVQLIR